MRPPMKITRLWIEFFSIPPGKVLIRSSVACLTLGLVFFGLALNRIDQVPLDGTPLEFDAKSAHATMWSLSKLFPHRLPWHENRRKAGDWLKSQLEGMGYAPQEMIFSEIIDGKTYSDLKNIFVEKRGKTHPNEIIMAVAHYDTTDTTIEGAMDDASGVGVVLELARIFSKIDPDRTLLFLLTDSEEFGAFWGARTFAKSFPRANEIVAAINFDFLAVGKQIAILMLCDGLKQGYTPLWLREMALSSIRSLGQVEARDFTNIVEFLERAVLIPPSDHGAFLAAGIPSFNWVGQNEDFADLMANVHHTPNDVAEAMEPASFASYGGAAERLIRSIDALPAISKDFRNYSYLKISKSLYVDGWGVVLLQVLGFVPFILYSLNKFGRILIQRPRARIKRVFINEAKNVAILIVSFLLGYSLIRLLPSLKVISQYEVYPATQKSVLLYNPNFLAILLVLALIAGAFFVFKNTFSTTEDSVGYLEIRHAFHGIFLSLAIVAGFIGNSYLTVLLLFPPAYLWTALRTRRGAGDRALNFLLLLGGAITFIGMSVALSTVFHIGVVYWYVFLSAAYGLISVYAAVLFLIILAILIRLFRSFVL